MTEQLSSQELQELVKSLRDKNHTLELEIEDKKVTLEGNDIFYRQIINHSFKGVLVIHGDAFKFMNVPAQDMLQASLSNIDKLKFSNIIHPDYRGELIQAISKIISGEVSVVDQTCEILALNGNSFNARLQCSKLNVNNNRQGRVLILIENTTDISINRTVDDKRLSASGFIEKHGDEGVLVLKRNSDKDSSLFSCNIESINGAGYRLLATTHENAIGKNLTAFIEPEIDIKVPLEIPEENDDDYEIYIKNLNRNYKFNLYPVSETNFVCKISDITDHYQTKLQLNSNLQRNELFTEVLTIFNSDKNYYQKHKEVLEIISYHFKTRRIAIFYNSDDNLSGNLKFQHAAANVPLLRDKFNIPYRSLPSFIKMLKERKMILGFSLKYLPEDLRMFFEDAKFGNAYIFPINIEEELGGAIVFENSEDRAWDTTEINYLKMISVLMANLASRQSFESKLLKAKEKAEEADRLKSSFLANMSHDIRIPMTAIIGFSDLLADPDLTIGEREEFIELISNSGQDLLTLIDNIVDVAKIETGQLKISKDNYSLLQLVKEVYNQNIKNNRLVNQDDLELLVDFPDKYHQIPFETDVFRFKQVLNNLIDNAIKFTDKGNIRFGVSNVWPGNIEFYVQDSGIGIAEDTQDVIFERFSKIDKSYTKEYNGTGLGLAICKSLVELMGGEIRLISYIGKGSTFYFTHPLTLAADKMFEHETPHTADTPYDWEGKTFIIAEDVEQNFKLLEFILMPTKATVIWAKNGKEAVNLVAEGRPVDCVLMDIRMPVMNGIEATREIIKIKHIPIIAQTAYTLGEEKALAIQAGCADYISKPVQAAVLLKIIEKQLKK